MTNVTVFGEKKIDLGRGKIVLTMILKDDMSFEKSNIEADNWENVLLLVDKYTEDGLDLIYCYDAQPNDGVLYLGHWNDGVV